MSFLAPGWLLLLLVVPLLWFVPRRATDVRHAALRSACLALLALALARPVVAHGGAAAEHVFVVDRSASVAGDASARAESYRAALAGGTRTALVTIGGGEETSSRFDVRVHVDGAQGSPLGASLAAAERCIADGAPGAITLFTDGRSTDVLDARLCERLTARGIPVHVAASPARDVGARVVDLDVREDLRVGLESVVRVRLAGVTSPVTVRLSEDGTELAAPATADRDGDLDIAVEPRAQGFLRITAALEGLAPEDTALTRTFPVQRAVHALYLGRRVRGAAPRLSELLGRGVRIDDSPAPETVPDVGAYDLIVLDDIPAGEVTPQTQQAIATAVVDGGTGLVLAGGPASFGPGGWYDTPIARVAPVEFVQREEKRDPSTTLVIIIDTSGSMGGNRVQLAKEVARLAMRRLLPHDKVGIVEFYGAKRWAAPIQPASNAIDLQRALNRLDAGGGTVILPAIEEAFYGMQNVETRYKHVLVLTDGGVETGAFEPLLRKMAEEGMNVSTVLIGSDAHSEFLVTLANWGKGRFYSVPNRFNLPEILLKQPTTARLPSYRPGTFPVRARAGRAWWGATPATGIPPLAGYVQTSARDHAEVVLETEDGGHPVITSWRHGLGRVTAVTTELVGPGTAPWRAWPGYGALLARAMTRTAADASPEFDFGVERVGERVHVTARRRTLSDTRPWAAVVADAVGGTDGTDGTGGAEGDGLRFRERAPGWFTADVDARRGHDLLLAAGVRGASAEQRVPLVAAELMTRRPELQTDPSVALDLPALAAATGGSVLPAQGIVELAIGGGRASGGATPLWPFALLAALIAYLCDVLLRRLPRRRTRAASAAARKVT